MRAQRSSRHKNCTLMVDNQHTWNSTPNSLLWFYLVFSKWNITSIQVPILRKKILLADKSENHYCIVTSQISWLLQHGMGSYAKPVKGQELLSFLSGGGGEKKLFVVLQCIFGRDFLSPRTTLVSGIENYPSTCISCCSDDLSLLLPCLDFWSLGSENLSVQEYIFASIGQSGTYSGFSDLCNAHS